MLVDRNNALGLSELHDHSSVRVEEHLAVAAAEECLGDRLPFYPGDPATAGVHAEELLGERVAFAAWTGGLLEERFLNPRRRRNLILVSLNSQLTELGVELVEDVPLRHEVGKRCLRALRHVEMVAE